MYLKLNTAFNWLNYCCIFYALHWFFVSQGFTEKKKCFKLILTRRWFWFFIFPLWQNTEKVINLIHHIWKPWIRADFIFSSFMWHSQQQHRAIRFSWNFFFLALSLLETPTSRVLCQNDLKYQVVSPYPKLVNVFDNDLDERIIRDLCSQKMRRWNGFLALLKIQFGLRMIFTGAVA